MRLKHCMDSGGNCSTEVPGGAVHLGLARFERTGADREKKGMGSSAAEEEELAAGGVVVDERCSRVVVAADDEAVGGPAAGGGDDAA